MIDMQKQLKLGLISLVLGFVVSFITAMYVGTAGPKYNMEAQNKNLCQSLALRYDDYKDVNYENGYPFKITGTTSVDVVCGGDPEKVFPDNLSVSWQFYGNASIYALSSFGILIFFTSIMYRRRGKR